MTASVLEHVLNCPSLPTLPGVAIRLLELTSKPDVPLKEIAATVQHDQALSAKILRTVNSSYYGLSKPCPTIPRALTLIGLNTVKSLVLGFSLVDSFRIAGELGIPEFDLLDHWRRSLYGAAGARLLAVRLGGCDPDEAFMAAMLQDVGVIACALTLKREYGKALAQAQSDHEALAAAEMKTCGVTHCEVGVALARAWRIPECILAGIEFHHSVDKAPSELRRIVQFVAIANRLTRIISAPHGCEALPNLLKDIGVLGEMTAEQLKEILAELVKGGRELSRLFDVDTSAKTNVAQLLADANERLVAHQLDLDRQNHELAANNAQLTRQVESDPLTGAFNRSHFNELIQCAFEESLTSGQPLSVAFVDADRFKFVNDTYGHHAGDRVLIEIARLARSHIGESGSVSRYGGEEFVLILPNQEHEAALSTMERLRSSIESAFTRAGDDGASGPGIPVTVSIGVATRASARPAELNTAAKLVQASDAAMYRAKQDGRNCVRSAHSKRDSNTRAPGCLEKKTAPALGGRASLRILLVEPDANRAELISRPMRSVGGIDVRLENSGQGAIHAVRQAAFGATDLILCSAELVDMQAATFVQLVREIDKLRVTPIVLMAPSDEFEGAAALAAGANAVIPMSRLAGDPHRRILQVVQFWCLAQAA